MMFEKNTKYTIKISPRITGGIFKKLRKPGGFE